ncbi:MAG: alpha/beta fold hydrolase [Candidatus Eremiobacteraeota bacterium]|nr:alpha/beta fold hydrolase [Candidatus Eremiobacteraeota bacterium]
MTQNIHKKYLAIVFLFCILFFILPEFSFAEKIEHYRLEQNGETTGFCEIEKTIRKDGSYLILERVYFPYDYFPNTVVREIIFQPESGKITKFKKTTYYDDGREIVVLNKGEAGFNQLLDYGRIFYINKNIRGIEGVDFLEDLSPALFSIFMDRNKQNTDGKRKVKYLIPSADASIKEGGLERKFGNYYFSGIFNSIIKMTDGKIKKIIFPNDSLMFFRIDKSFKEVMIRNPGIIIKQYNNKDNSFTNSPVNISSKKINIYIAPPYKKLSHPYKEIPVSFISHDGTRISGILSIPKAKAPHPGFILVPGSGSYDRSGGGLLYHISDMLARNGIATLRYDKRGVGESDGICNRATLNDLVLDADSAVEFLAGRKEIDPLRMGILGHSEGALIASRVAIDNKNIRGVILMASPSVRMFPDMVMEQSIFFDNFNGWTKEASLKLRESITDVKTRIDNGHAWYEFNGSRISMKSLISYYKSPDPLKVIKNIKCPAIVLHGENDIIVPVRHGKNIYLALKESGNENIRMIILTDTGHFFGEFIQPGKSYPYRKYVKPYDQILDSIIKWVREYYI